MSKWKEKKRLYIDRNDHGRVIYGYNLRRNMNKGDEVFYKGRTLTLVGQPFKDIWEGVRFYSTTANCKEGYTYWVYWSKLYSEEDIADGTDVADWTEYEIDTL
jgi:hypothetical protein